MIKLEAATLSDPGRKRQINEDRAWAQIYEASDEVRVINPGKGNKGKSKGKGKGKGGGAE